MTAPLADEQTLPVTEQEEPVTQTEQPNAEQEPADTQVSKLRAEAAEHRVKAREASERGDALAELLLTRTLEQASHGVLVDSELIDRSDPRLYDENGFPSLQGAQEVALELADAKPYLAAPRGEIQQGYKPEQAVETLGGIIRGVLHA